MALLAMWPRPAPPPVRPRRARWDAGLPAPDLEELAQFPNCSLAEDAAFLDQAARRGARLQAVEAAGVFIYVRHGTNAWSFACGMAGGADGWELVPEPELPIQDRSFYSARSAVAPPQSPAPLVSCVMPTWDRRSFVPQSVRYFLRQDYPARELVIVDDGPEPVHDLVPADPRIVYHRLGSRTVLGTKRNLACDLARGSVIMHWDDDDWASPRRVSVQVAALIQQGADICGDHQPAVLRPCSLVRLAVHLARRPAGLGSRGQPLLCQGAVESLPLLRHRDRRRHPLRLEPGRAPGRRRPRDRLHRRGHTRPERRPQDGPRPALEFPACP